MRATALLAVLALPACLPGGRGELEDVSNLDAHWERVWDHASVRRKLQPAPGLPPGLRELRVLREPQGYGRADTLELQVRLWSSLLPSLPPQPASCLCCPPGASRP